MARARLHRSLCATLFRRPSRALPTTDLTPTPAHPRRIAPLRSSPDCSTGTMLPTRYTLAFPLSNWLVLTTVPAPTGYYEPPTGAPNPTSPASTCGPSRPPPASRNTIPGSGRTLFLLLSRPPGRKLADTLDSEAWRYEGPFTRWNRFKGGLPGLGTASVAFAGYCAYEYFFLEDEHHHGEGHH